MKIDEKIDTAIGDPSERFSDGPRLLADIGGTNARFVLETRQGHLEAVAVLPCDDYATLLDAITTYMDSAEAKAVGAARVRHAAIAIANPIDDDVIKMMNHHWFFSIEEMRTALGLDTLLVVNDFTALAMALPHLRTDQRLQIGGGIARADSVIGLLGSGTGLGVSGMIPAEDRWIALGSEGGHVSFAPCDQREMDVLAFAWRELPHVSAERLASGRGLELIYRALSERAGKPDVQPLAAAEITSRALSGECAVCLESIECFCAILGSIAGNVAMTLGALGGIYIGGGIVPRLGPLFAQSQFRARFEQKGRLNDYLAQIPTYLIIAELPTFLGIAAILAQKLKRAHSGAPMLETVRQARGRMSPSECKVADWVLKEPNAMLTLPIAEIAHRIGVSQPTVMRFCRSIGVQGLADFKLKLASGLTTGGAITVAHCHVEISDTDAELARKVLGNNASAALALRDMLDVKALTAAIELLRNANRVELLSVGSARVVAEDMQQKLLNLGIVSTYFPDPQAQEMSAGLLKPSDVALVISRSGELPELLRAVKAARACGAQVLAITSSGSPLAKLADVLLAVNHQEGNLNFVPMIVRLLQLMMLDILSVGLARRDTAQRSGAIQLEQGQQHGMRISGKLKFGGHLE
ncbi:glucokinase [Janthinobacterium agaricidamnosum]|uniref:Glucokinase n=1 Tax=Janthinobacterium agaricidamnosum NBRC 102515 = DSM 9628 TaxID=1349767 RepID=W0V469_9BURK|nr:glucokinase [Janthinobacterium agaricidamnosum]CDG83624.1 glucokinase [Janthinobacterium agaricidamnosum NBRC 102515 = DSM 9628]